jgi:hypothetical protein
MLDLGEICHMVRLVVQLPRELPLWALRRHTHQSSNDLCPQANDGKLSEQEITNSGQIKGRRGASAFMARRSFRFRRQR